MHPAHLRAGSAAALMQPGVWLQAEAALAASRPPGLPHIAIVAEIAESQLWATEAIDIPFAATNDLLGRQLSCAALAGVR